MLTHVYIGFPVIFIKIAIKLHLSRQVSKNTEMPNFMKIRPVTAELLHDGGYDEANSRFS